MAAWMWAMGAGLSVKLINRYTLSTHTQIIHSDASWGVVCSNIIGLPTTMVYPQ